MDITGTLTSERIVEEDRRLRKVGAQGEADRVTEVTSHSTSHGRESVVLATGGS